MAYRYGNREQLDLFPPSIEDYISEDNPVRAYDAFVNALDLNELGIKLDEDKVGNPEYDPRVMLKLFVYGFSYGFRSSRKLERAVHDNFSFIWLMGGLKPDHKTIAEFRRKNKNALKNVIRQCAKMCIALGLIEGNTLFCDGSKIRSDAGIKNTWNKERCEKLLKRLDKQIDTILSECDFQDEKEKDQESLIRLREELKHKEALKSKVKQIAKELKEDNKKFLNTTDPDSTRFRSIHGSHIGYNTQLVVDGEQGLIVNSDVVGENNDRNQFANQINQANETLGKKCDTACADSGYSDTEELERIDKQDIKVIVPSQEQVSRKVSKEFDKERFRYDPEGDRYICREGHILKYRSTHVRDKCKRYRITKRSICRECRHFGGCTSSKRGREINRLIKEETRLKLKARYEQPENQAIYDLRKQKAELPFGHIKRNLGVRAFLLRGLDGVRAEMSLLASCFNVTRMITILGVAGLVKELDGIKRLGVLCLIGLTHQFRLNFAK